MADPPLARVRVLPDYGKGFTFAWEVAGGFSEPGPWQFIVQMAPSPEGDWRDISPILTNVYAWRSVGPFRVNKSFVLYFRVLMRTGTTIHSSLPVTPYGDLDRREFLIGKEIMRREVLHARNLAGVEVDLWSASTWGPRCDCKDPVTGHVRNSSCKKCFGTGFNPGYHGPFSLWGSFSEDSNHTLEHSQDGAGLKEQKIFQMRIVAAVPIKKNDVVHDRRSGKRYYVQAASSAAEIRRVPLVQSCVLSEIATTDPAYQVGVR